MRREREGEREGIVEAQEINTFDNKSFLGILFGFFGVFFRCEREHAKMKTQIFDYTSSVHDKSTVGRCCFNIDSRMLGNKWIIILVAAFTAIAQYLRFWFN